MLILASELRAPAPDTTAAAITASAATESDRRLRMRTGPLFCFPSGLLDIGWLILPITHAYRNYQPPGRCPLLYEEFTKGTKTLLREPLQRGISLWKLWNDWRRRL